MTAARAVEVLVATGVGLSLLGLTLLIVCTAALSIHTVVGAIQRNRHRPAAAGELAGVFPIEVLAELDEALERCLLDARGSPPP